MTKPGKLRFKKLFNAKQETTSFRQWTDAARTCYKNKCNCAKCELDYICKKQAKDNQYNLTPMKYAVLKLVEKFGKP